MATTASAATVVLAARVARIPPPPTLLLLPEVGPVGRSVRLLVGAVGEGGPATGLGSLLVGLRLGFSFARGDGAMVGESYIPLPGDGADVVIVVLVGVGATTIGVGTGDLTVAGGPVLGAGVMVGAAVVPRLGFDGEGSGMIVSSVKGEGVRESRVSAKQTKAQRDSRHPVFLSPRSPLSHIPSFFPEQYRQRELRTHLVGEAVSTPAVEAENRVYPNDEMPLLF